MKRALIIFILVVALGLGFAFLFRGSSPQPQWLPATQLSFLGFTNAISNVAATNAWFGIRRIPRETTAWRTVEISHREGTKWKSWEPLPSTSFAWLYPKPADFDLGATIPVEATTGSFRIVIELKREPTGKTQEVWQKVRTWLSRFTHGTTDRLWKARQPTFYITNEFNITGETSSVSPVSNQ